MLLYYVGKIGTLEAARQRGNVFSGDVVLADGAKFYIGNISRNNYLQFNTASSQWEFYAGGVKQVGF